MSQCMHVVHAHLKDVMCCKQIYRFVFYGYTLLGVAITRQEEGLSLDWFVEA